MKLIELTRKLLPIAKAAGELEMKYFNQGEAVSAEIQNKGDSSPVTIADQEAEDLIKEALSELAPGIPFVGEESVEAGHIPNISDGKFWCVDALDGTKSFIRGDGDFTVNIALLQNFVPVAGIIYIPTTGEFYFGAEGEAFMKTKDGVEKKIRVRKTPNDGICVVASKRHENRPKVEELLQGYNVASMTNRSSSLKFCEVAAGNADLYPRLAPTSEWDTAAGDAILRAAGGIVCTLDGNALTYGKVDTKFLNPSFLAKGSLRLKP